MKHNSSFVMGASVAVGILAAAGTAFAGFDGAGIISTNGYSAIPGGEFTLTPTSGFVGITGQAADLSSNSFETFCIEVNEHFSPGGTYNLNMNIVSILGGSGGPSYPLDIRTAYLYTHFRAGDLIGFDYTPANRQASAGALQAAIWFLQGNQPGGSNNGFVTLADAAVLGGWNSIGDVRILNVYDGNGGLGQDQLTLVPTPGAAALMGVGMLAASRRRRA